MIVAEAARLWRQAGVSTIPVLDNGTKRPAIRWAEYQVRVPELGEVDHWWGNGRELGLALICGSVSGNLEMTEIEGRATGADAMVAIANIMDEIGATATWDLLTKDGYMEMSPSGGIHFLYRISDHPVPGNTKIAQGGDQLVLAETRGEGGYVIVAPTTGLCHPSGESWNLLRGVVGELPLITWEQRCALHKGLKMALDVAPVSTALDVIPEAPVPSLSSPETGPPRDAGTGASPNDDFEARTDWPEILEPHGWRLESVRHGERFWTRPGKDPRLGASATTGFKEDRDRFYVFSTSTEFQAEESYTKYRVYSILNHGGDNHAATRELVRRGFGSVRIPVELGEIERSPKRDPNYIRNDTGNAQYLRDRVDGRFLYFHPEKIYYFWDGKVWAPDLKGELEREYKALCADRFNLAEDEKAGKYWTSSGNAGRVLAALRMMQSEPGVTVVPKDMNKGAGLLNVANGILDLKRGELLPHDPKLRQIRMFGASFDPHATCPNFDAFIQAAVPDDDMRGYLQRAMGYSLLGDADRRAMFLIYGPSGTGKSTLMETIRAIFGDYGTTAAAGAFRDRNRDGGATNDLHGLRHKRFVTTSETAEGANFDEDLLKRLTGRDSVTSRELYQANQEWIPECTLWLATNHPPKFNSDDDAIWRRAKLIPFTTQFTGAGEIHDMSRRMLVPEANGILNWLLAGLRAFLAHGLGEPAAVVQAAKDLRSESDSVVRFLDDYVIDGTLALGEGYVIKSKELYLMYQAWCHIAGERPLRTRRFAHRLESADRGLSCVRGEAGTDFHGVGRGYGYTQTRFSPMAFADSLSGG